MKQIGFKTNLTTMKLNSTIPRVSVVLALALGAGTASATLLSEESFLVGPGQYSLGAVDTQNPANSFYSGGWMAQGGANDVQVVGTSLYYPGLQTSGGSLATGTIPASASLGRAGRNLATPWTDSTSGTYYISFLASFGNTDGSPVHHRVIEAWNAPSLPGDANRSLEVGYSEFTGLGTTLSLSINNGGSGVNETDYDNNIAIGTDNGATHLFVLRFDLSQAAGGDVVYGYLDPTDLVNEPGSPNAVLFGFDFSLASFGSMVQFVFNGNAPGSTGYFDELRFGTTYADVLPAAVPEPATFSLAGLAGLALIFRARRQKA
jgi:hypothetical protein